MAWTRSRPYKKNDQAHVEQKNFTHVRQLLGYERYDQIELKVLVEELYKETWLPLRNFFTPVMKLIEKERTGSKVKKTYDEPQTPYQRLQNCSKFEDESKRTLKEIYQKLDPIDLQRKMEYQLGRIFELVNERASERAEEELLLKGGESGFSSSVTAPLRMKKRKPLS